MSNQQTTKTITGRQTSTVALDFDKYLKEVKEEVEVGFEDFENEDLGEKTLRDITVTNSILGDYIKQISVYKVMTQEEEIEAFKRFEAGSREAYEEIYTRNLRLVLSIAKHFFSISVTMDPMDLVMEGNIGLMTAIRRFDYKKGYKFSTYATWWIKQAISRSMSNNSNMIRIPIHMLDSLFRYRKHIKELEKSGITIFDPEAIAEELGMTVNQVVNLRNIDNNMINIASLNKSINQDEDNDTELMTMIPSHAKSVEDEYVNKDLSETLLRMIDDWVAKCPEKNRERRKEIVIRRYGLDGSAPETLESIGTSMGITRERVRQIENQFIKYAKLPRNKAQLKDYVQE